MRKHRSNLEWASILGEYARSGQSVGVFCRERGIDLSSLYRRLRKLPEEESEFIELPRGCEPAQYEVFVGGVTLRIPGNERADRIAEIVKALGC